jgi:hypothetical protein
MQLQPDTHGDAIISSATYATIMPATTVRATIDTAFQKGNFLEIMTAQGATAMICDNGIRRFRGYHVYGRQTRRRLSGDGKPSAKTFGVVTASPAARNALCIEAITPGQCSAYSNKFRASASSQLRTALWPKRSK